MVPIPVRVRFSTLCLYQVKIGSRTHIVTVRATSRTESGWTCFVKSIIEAERLLRSVVVGFEREIDISGIETTAPEPIRVVLVVFVRTSEFVGTIA